MDGPRFKAAVDDEVQVSCSIDVRFQNMQMRGQLIILTNLIVDLVKLTNENLDVDFRSRSSE
jgi:hypothetical protein